MLTCMACWEFRTLAAIILPYSVNTYGKLGENFSFRESFFVSFYLFIKTFGRSVVQVRQVGINNNLALAYNQYPAFNKRLK